MSLGLLLALGLASAQNLDLASIYESQGRYTEAQVLFADALRTGGFNSQTYNRYKAVTLRLERYADAVAFTDSLLVKNPGQPDLLMGKAEALLRSPVKADNRVGRAALDGMVRTDPEYARQVGTIYEACGLDRDAIAVYLDYRRKKNNPAIFAPNLVTLYEHSGDLAAATREAVMMLNVSPGRVSEFEGKFLFYVTKSAGPVIAELKQLKNRPVQAELLAKAYLALGRNQEALEEVKWLDSPRKAEEFARYCEERGYLEPAHALFGMLKQQYDQARILKKQGKYEDAAAMLGRSSDPNSQFELAELQREVLHDYAAAAIGYEAVTKLQPGRDPAYLGWAECLLHAGKLEDAARVYRAMPRPTDAGLLGSARLAFYREQFDTCSMLVDSLVRLAPQSPLVNDGLEYALLITRDGEGLSRYVRARRDYELGKPDSAASLAREIIRTDSAWSDQAYLLAADCYRAQKQANQALAALEELEKNRPASPFRAKARFVQALILSEDLKDEARYQKTMTSVFTDFPESPYAALARNRLLPSSKPRE
jgi:tetratricopeptide (TPR) repeat protein